MPIMKKTIDIVTCDRCRSMREVECGTLPMGWKRVITIDYENYLEFKDQKETIPPSIACADCWDRIINNSDDE